MIDVCSCISPVAALVLGASGQLGRACAALWGDRALALAHSQVDISDRADVRAVIERIRPGLIVNCAAATDVDRCETDHDYADSANWHGPECLAELANEYGVRLAHVSTDFVFAGDKPSPYVETDTPGPVNYYGLSKLCGENAVLAAHPDALVIRTSWVFGDGVASFPRKVLKWAGRGEPLRVVTDHRGSPTYASDLAWGMSVLLDQDISGLVHLAGAGCASRFDIAVETLRMAGSPVVVAPAQASEFPLPAPRPAATCLDCSKAASFGVIMPTGRKVLRVSSRGRYTLANTIICEEPAR